MFPGITHEEVMARVDEYRELNVKVAEALGWTDVELASGGAYGAAALRGKKPDSGYAWCLVPHYSTSIAAAWGLVEQITQTHSFGMSSTWRMAKGGIEGTEWNIVIRKRGEIEPQVIRSLTAPEAICRAFLAAKGE